MRRRNLSPSVAARRARLTATDPTALFLAAVLGVTLAAGIGAARAQEGAALTPKPAASATAKPETVKVAPSPSAPTQAASPAATPAAGIVAKPVAAKAKTVAKPATTPAGAKPASGAAASAASAKPSKIVTTSKTGVATSAAKPKTPLGHVDEHVTYQYNTLGRRDPFTSLVDGEFVGVDVGGDAPPDVGGIKVVGIVWGDTDKFALVEDARGNSHVLRRGDKVMNGFVEELKRDAMIVNITVDGQTETVTVPLTRKGDKSNATR